jgi:hypothetical protein
MHFVHMNLQVVRVRLVGFTGPKAVVCQHRISLADGSVDVGVFLWLDFRIEVSIDMNESAAEFLFHSLIALTFCQNLDPLLRYAGYSLC